jgi:hypothetical protein
MTRLLALLVTLALLSPAPAALAQGGGAFGPLPPATPAETPTPEPQDDGGFGEDVSRETLFLVALGVILTFVVLGWAITRDARRNLNESDRASVEGTRLPGAAPRKQDRAKIKQKARQKTRQQRQARKKTRRAGR